MAKIEFCAVFHVEREEILVLRVVEKKASIFWKFGKFSMIFFVCFLETFGRVT